MTIFRARPIHASRAFTVVVTYSSTLRVYFSWPKARAEKLLLTGQSSRHASITFTTTNRGQRHVYCAAPGTRPVLVLWRAIAQRAQSPEHSQSHCANSKYITLRELYMSKVLTLSSLLVQLVHNNTTHVHKVNRISNGLEWMLEYAGLVARHTSYPHPSWPIMYEDFSNPFE